MPAALQASRQTSQYAVCCPSGRFAYLPKMQLYGLFWNELVQIGVFRPVFDESPLDDWTVWKRVGHVAESFRFGIHRFKPASEHLIAWSEIRRANASRRARLCTQRCVTSRRNRSVTAFDASSLPVTCHYRNSNHVSVDIPGRESERRLSRRTLRVRPRSRSSGRTARRGTHSGGA